MPQRCDLAALRGSGDRWMASGADIPGEAEAAGIGWATRVLLGAAADEVTVTVGRRPPRGHRVLWSFAPLPSARRPYVLVPLGSAAAAAAALHGLGNPLLRSRRMAEASASVLMRTGVPQRAPVPIHLTVPRGASVDREDVGVFGRLLEVYGRDDLAFGVILGRDRPNRKPVLKVITLSGTVVGFAKVGWNDLSRALVRDEAIAIARVRDARPRSFEVPALTLAERFGAVELLVVDPIEQPRLRDPSPPLELPEEPTWEVAQLGGSISEPMRTGAYGEGLRARVEGGSYLRTQLGEALDRIDAAWGDASIAVGSWHGDWIPWNMGYADGRLVVWDWERSTDGVPVGLDAMHFAFEVALKVRGMPASEAARRATGSVTSALERLGADPEHARALMAYQLIEMGLRFRAGAAAGLPVRHAAYLEALAATVGGPA
jgi:hypothetical protein